MNILTLLGMLPKLAGLVAFARSLPALIASVEAALIAIEDGIETADAALPGDFSKAVSGIVFARGVLKQVKDQLDALGIQ